MQYHHHQIVEDIRKANPFRSPDSVRRRLLKILEEVGEASEAYLSRTGIGNYKNKSWDDYREESVDTLIVLVDVALTDFDCNFPAGALLSNHLLDAIQTSLTNHSDLENRKFEVVHAVAHADQCLQRHDFMRFHGAMARGIRAAAEMVYARYGDAELSTEKLDEVVYEVITRKLAKWTARMNEPVPSHSAFVDFDIKSYMEVVEDRHA